MMAALDIRARMKRWAPSALMHRWMSDRALVYTVTRVAVALWAPMVGTLALLIALSPSVTSIWGFRNETAVDYAFWTVAALSYWRFLIPKNLAVDGMGAFLTVWVFAGRAFALFTNQAGVNLDAWERVIIGARDTLLAFGTLAIYLCSVALSAATYMRHGGRDQ